MKIVSATVSLIGFVAIAFSAGCRSAPAADTLSATLHDLPGMTDIKRPATERALPVVSAP